MLLNLQNQIHPKSIIKEEFSSIKLRNHLSGNYSPQSTKSSGSDRAHFRKIFSFSKEEARRPSKFQVSNLGGIQQVKAVGRDLLTQALQKRLHNIGNIMILNFRVQTKDF